MEDLQAAARPKLLYVDDERPNLVALRALLRDTYEVLIAERAEEAFLLLQSNDIPLIVSDQRMPGMTGTQFLEKVAEEYPDNARMILTGYADIDAVIEAINRSQIYYYFKKPWNETEIRLTLANALESVQTRRKLIDSEHRFRSTFEQAGLGIAHLQLHGEILRANGQLREFLGRSEAELLGQPFQTWFAGFDPEELLPAPGRVVVREAPVPTPGGPRWSRLTSSVSLDRKGVPDYLIALVDDLTERRHTEEQVIKLSHAVEQCPVSIRITDRAGVVEFVNPRFTEMTGYSAEEVVGKPADVFLTSQDDAGSAKGELQACLAAGAAWEGELLNHRKDGAYFWARITVSPICNKEGEVTHYLILKDDITERHKLEEQLRQSQKMEAIGQLAGGVAHDFNNILMVIMGYGSMLTADALLGSRQKEKVEHILESAEKGAQLTASLLAFSRKQVMKLEAVNLNDVILHVEKFLTRVIGEDVQLRSVISAAPLPVNVDCGQIEQVLMNLATNARDAMPKGGVLTIETSWQALEERRVMPHDLGEPGNYAVISVSDTGLGMDEATRSRVFEPFFTTKEQGKGTGLGMSIVYGIVKQHNGFVNVYSEPQVGTTFRIYLPLIETVESGDRPRGDFDPPRAGSETILVVEDEPVLRELLQSILVEYGYRVILAEDGLDAVEKFRGAGSVDLVLMDMIMPRMNGKEACDAIRAMNPAVKVAFTSGYTRDFVYLRDSIDAGTELIMKPVQPMELLRRMRDILDR
ncbi:response regulator [Geomonas nitrogeniifigens]|uniref:histidine kinase n=1 Tax=Geomonas diazotrophica TaxID=2843197 RepID=A0ABX8JK90_9BACT|nr:response regulator [Geomonas nitrogeniifigens]QWV97877.1 response regulator [Geomonas nitrogeniifigens]QXE87017.1 response regulator [Geomonas nitrogeniifigens]